MNQGDAPAYFDAVAGDVLTRRLNAAEYVVVSASAIPLGGRRDDADKERFDVRQLSAALLSAGIRMGRDVLVVTLANKGNLPVHPDPIDFILHDPVRDADAIADALIAYLDTGVAPGAITLETAFVAGEG